MTQSFVLLFLIEDSLYSFALIFINLTKRLALGWIKWHGTSYKNNNEVYEKCSYNFKSSNIHASIALVMLETYSDRLNRLKEIYLMYEDGLKDLSKFFKFYYSLD